jgi:hypothetical protein
MGDAWVTWTPYIPPDKASRVSSGADRSFNKLVSSAGDVLTI